MLGEETVEGGYLLAKQSKLAAHRTDGCMGLTRWLAGSSSRGWALINERASSQGRALRLALRVEVGREGGVQAVEVRFRADFRPG